MAIFGKQTAAESQIVPGEPPKKAEEPEESQELFKPLNTTIIAEGVVITGDIQGEGVIRVEGSVEGQVNLQGSVVVTPTGSIKGPVEANAVRVAGAIEGNIVANDHLLLEQSGRIDGDVTTVSFVIEEGGWLNGRTSMVKKKKELAQEAAPREEPVPEKKGEEVKV